MVIQCIRYPPFNDPPAAGTTRANASPHAIFRCLKVYPARSSPWRFRKLHGLTRRGDRTAKSRAALRRREGKGAACGPA